MSKAGKGARGFTLLELLVVLVLIGLMSALVVPNLGGSLSNVNLRTVSKKIAASLRYARSQATSQYIIHGALFDFDKNRLSIIPDRTDSDVTGQVGTEGEEQGSPGSKSYDLPDGVTLDGATWGDRRFDSGLFEILFFPGGGSSGGEVIVVNDREKRSKITVDFITGAVKLSVVED